MLKVFANILFIFCIPLVSVAEVEQDQCNATKASAQSVRLQQPTKIKGVVSVNPIMNSLINSKKLPESLSRAEVLLKQENKNQAEMLELNSLLETLSVMYTFDLVKPIYVEELNQNNECAVQKSVTLDISQFIKNKSYEELSGSLMVMQIIMLMQLGSESPSPEINDGLTKFKVEFEKGIEVNGHLRRSESPIEGAENLVFVIDNTKLKDQ